MYMSCSSWESIPWILPVESTSYTPSTKVHLYLSLSLSLLAPSHSLTLCLNLTCYYYYSFSFQSWSHSNGVISSQKNWQLPTWSQLTSNLLKHNTFHVLHNMCYSYSGDCFSNLVIFAFITTHNNTLYSIHDIVSCFYCSTVSFRV